MIKKISKWILITSSLFFSTICNAGTITVTEETTRTVTVPKVITEIVTETVETTVTEEVTNTVLTPTTSPNLLENQGFEKDNNGNTVTDWSVTGGAVQIRTNCGPSKGTCAKTNNASTGGSTLTQTMNLNDTMTVDEINAGFSLSYGSDVWSHRSNQTVGSCTSITQANDCKDVFSITLTLTDEGDVVQEWEHEFELTTSGWDTSTYDFTQTVGSNDYTEVSAMLELFGVDAGFHSGFFGPRFDNTSLTVTYDAISFVTEQITRTITEEIEKEIQRTIFVQEDRVFVTTREIEVPDPISMETSNMSVSAIESPGTDITTEIETVEVMASPAIEPIAAITTESTSSNIETISEAAPAIEAIETESIVSIGTTESDSSEVEASVENTVQEIEAKVEQEMASSDTVEPVSNNVAEVKDKQSSEDSGSNETVEVKVKVEKSETKKEIASNVANSILNSMDRYGAVTQVTQLAIMNSIGVGSQFSTYETALADQSTWYDSTSVYASMPQLRDPTSTILTGAQNLQMDALISSGKY